MIIGIDHGYYAMKTPHICFPTGLSRYDYEPYTMQNVLQYAGNYYVCGTGRQTLMKDKTANDNYYLLTMAALAQEIEYRRAERKGKIILAAGLPLAGFGREKTAFRQYLFRKEQPLCFRYENESYELTIEDVKLFPQGYSALALHPEYVRDEPSVLLVDIGGWTVDLMRLDNRIPNAATCRSLELGMIRCLDEISEQVRQIFGVSMTDAQIESVLRGGAIGADDRVRAVIHAQAGQYVRDLLSTIMESGLDVRAMSTIFLGGGAALLKRHVSATEGLCRPLLLDDVSLNAKGYERLTARMLGGEHGV